MPFQGLIAIRKWYVECACFFTTLGKILRILPIRMRFISILTKSDCSAHCQYCRHAFKQVHTKSILLKSPIPFK